MNHSNFSQYYYELVGKSSQLHQNSKTWNGFSQLAYVQDIKQLAEKHKINSLLDYGCGKGQQYEEKIEYQPNVFQTLG